MSRLFSSVALGTALFLSACGVGTVSYVNVDSSYDPVQYARLPYTGPLYVEVSGNPFSIPSDQMAKVVYDAIAPSNAAIGNGQGPRLHFAFGPDASNFNLACSAAGTAGQVNGRISMVAALCRGTDHALTYLSGSIDGVTGPDDPRFRQFLRQATVQLFPTQTDESRERQRDSLCIWPSC
ncbi:MAG TPA: hypothetical protein VHA07_13655 [Devosia sp.]|nr:hypothetical protein [Devosia sp.]